MGCFWRIAACIVICCVCPILYADPFEMDSDDGDWDDETMLEDFYGDADMISIATGKAQPIAKAPSVATVITAKQIEQMGATDLDQILETVPGLHVSVDPFGYNSIYLIRGIYAQYNPQVLMLINGVPVSSLFHGGRHLLWGGMPVKAIHRVEVIRGPGSAIYGADAFAGVINIMTKSGAEIEGINAGVRTGSFDAHSAWLSASTTVGDGLLGTVIEYGQTDGQDEIIQQDAQTQLDTIFGTQASLAPGPVNLMRKNLDLRLDYRLGNWHLRSGYVTRRDMGSGIGVAGALDPNNRYRSDRISANITYHRLGILPNWDIKGSLNFLDTSQRIEADLMIYPAGVNLGAGVYPDGLIGNPEVYESHWRADLIADYIGLQDHALKMGVGYYLGDIRKVRETKNFGINPTTDLPLPLGSPVIDVSDTPYAFLPEVDRKNYYLFLQEIWRISRDWELTAGVRYDDYSDFGDTVNPRFAIVWSTSPALTSKILYGQAFRSPSIAQSFAVNNPVVLGNPNLAPETLESIELAFDYQWSDAINWKLNFFHYSWDDIIQFIPDSNASTQTAQNAGEQTGRGFEVEVSWQINSAFKVQSNYAFQDSEDKVTGDRPAQSPRQQFFATLSWQRNEQWFAHMQLNAVFDRTRAIVDTREALDDYQLTHFTVNRRSENKSWDLQFQIRNIFDENAKEPSPWSTPAVSGDLPLAGRHYLMSLSFTTP